MAKKQTEKAFATMLSYTRSISPTRGSWWTWYGDDRAPSCVEVTTSSFSGSISNFIEPSKFSTGRGTNIDAANIQVGDTCNLDVEAKGFIFKFGLSIVANSMEPDGCNNLETRQLLKKFSMSSGEVYLKLARMYVINLLKGGVLWRNSCALNKEMTIEVRYKNEGPCVDYLVVAIDDLEHMSLQECNTVMPLLVNSAKSTIGLDDLIRIVAVALTSKASPAVLDVSIIGHLPGGHDIYPSQEFIVDANEKRSRVLDTYTARTEDGRIIRAAATHPQKIGNALRQIDIWHDDVEDYGALPVEMYGYSRKFGIAVRTETKGNNIGFYSLLSAASLNDMMERLGHGVEPERFIPTELIDRHILFFTACLIRGGVFGRKED